MISKGRGSLKPAVGGGGGRREEGGGGRRHFSKEEVLFGMDQPAAHTFDLCVLLEI